MLCTASALFLLLAISLQKSYAHIPLKELKRRSRDGDVLAKSLHQAATYGVSLDVLLWLWIGFAGALFTYVLSAYLPTVVVALGVASIIWIGFAWLPNGNLSGPAQKMAAWCAPVLAWILNFVHPFFERVGLIFADRTTSHTKLYEKEDLLDLLKQQQKQADSRLSKEELSIAMHAMQFGDTLVRDVLTPKRVVREVSIDEKIGPILMEELHKSGHSRFPVYEKRKDNVVGTLMLRDLIGKKAGGTVKDVMHKDVYYLHESQNLYQAMTAMLKTRHHLFVVVNAFEEIVGVISLEDVIEQIIGKPIIDEFDRYDDLREVAASQAKNIHEEQEHEKLPDNDQR